MKTQHTPGPWEHDNTWNIIYGPKGEEVAAIHSAGSSRRCDKPIAQANAQLISLAPEMLSALIDLVSPYDGNIDGAPTAIKNARAIIAKATS